MKLRTISTLAALSLAIPLGSYAIKSQAQTDYTFSETNTTIMSQRPSEAGPYRRGKDKGQRIERMIQQLDLTPEQTEQINAIREESRSENEALKQEIRSNRQQMQSLLASDASSNELRQQHQQMQRLHQQMGDRRFETMLQIREVLTPEQRAKMAELISNRSESRGFRRLH
ncbi:MAG: Spy/CpxP family protein refolding chaperone [Xenococcaceae cyanobacterium MO_234.B1]|nr:Spy/CpxP family protein refolding chaperone [Xenococcaceae cyanobacterium MO_234.B1]